MDPHEFPEHAAAAAAARRPRARREHRDRDAEVGPRASRGAGACDGFACVYFNSLAWKTDTSPLPVEINPRVTFERMFGETGSTAERLQRLQYKRSMLDSVTQEVARLRNQLGPRDQRILGDYLENVREVERRIQQVMKRSEASIEMPAAPTGVLESMEEHVTLTYDLMQDTPDGDGSLLDHSLLYYGGGMSNGNAHDRYNPPAVVVGGASGRMQGHGNRHVAVNRAPSVNLLLNIAEMAGVRLEKIGPSTGRLDI